MPASKYEDLAVEDVSLGAGSIKAKLRIHLLIKTKGPRLRIPLALMSRVPRWMLLTAVPQSPMTIALYCKPYLLSMDQNPTKGERQGAINPNSSLNTLGCGVKELAQAVQM